MNQSEKYEKAINLLTANNQQHILAFYDELDSARRQSLLSQIDDLDFTQIPPWIEKYVKNSSSLVVPTDFQPAPSYPPRPETYEQREKYSCAKRLGTELIADCKVAAFVVAGGQGTRLGFDGPKGNLPISPVKNKTLFQLFAEMILAVSKKYSVNLPWYIMTSPFNHAETIRIFESSNYFGMKKSDVFIFQQGTVPNFSSDGKILLMDKSTIATSPDGHGGSLKALYKSGAMADMKTRGIEHISFFQVDNPLINIFDPLFIGLHALDKAQMSSKAVLKTGPMEKVGNFCMVDGKIVVIEYSDIDDASAQKKNPDGSLVFELGSIAIHLIDTAFVEKLNTKGFVLPIHRAVKKIAHVDDKGNPVMPAEPNGIKLETFTFDALQLADRSIILQVDRDEEFAPTKNSTGVDSVESASEMMTARAAKWLAAAGANIPKKSDGSPDCAIEIASSFAIAAKDINPEQIPQISPNDSIYLQ